MTDPTLPVARSPRRLRREMLRANRFFGLHQALLGLLLSPLVIFIAEVLTGATWQHWWFVPAYLTAWGIVELLFLRRRLAIHRLAIRESEAEVRRVAIRHGIAMKDVELRD